MSNANPFIVENPIQRPPTAQFKPAPSVPRASHMADDYERWYTEPAPNNRMILALKSGIDSEISWALDRLCRLCQNDQFVLRTLPGLTEALFEWPSWYVKGGHTMLTGPSALFATSKDLSVWIRHALESMFILRNAACHPGNAQELVSRRSTQGLILLTLHHLKPETETNVEFLLDTIELLQSIASTSVLPPPDSPVFANPVPPLLDLAGTSTDRAIIIAAMEALHLLFSNPPNIVHLTADSPALYAAIRYLPLVEDKKLVEACLNYLYTHLSHPPMTKAFLLNKELNPTLRLLVLAMLAEQREEIISMDIAGPVYTAPMLPDIMENPHELTAEEFDRLLPISEPQRCFDWMRVMFEPDDMGELTQVEFWNLYKDAFTPYQDQYYALPASEVIKNVSLVYPSAVAMVIPGTPQRFIVRGVKRKRDNPRGHRFQCKWDHQECPQEPLASAGELYEHVLEEHINPRSEQLIPCTWGTCDHGVLSRAHIRGHVLTHLPTSQPQARYPGQEEHITLPSEGFPHPIPNPTTRPVPPVRSAAISWPVATNEPSSSALTALLCIRVLYRASFASAEAAPRVDDEHFGFPGLVEEVGEKEGDEEVTSGTASELEGERRGRKAFVLVRHLLERVRLKDDTLMGWIAEMVDAGLTGMT